MDNKKNARKVHTKCALNWYLDVGKQLGTLDKDKAMLLAHVKKITFHRWLVGKLAAPVAKIELIKRSAFGCSVTHRAINKKVQPAMPFKTEQIEANFLWKKMIFNQLNKIAKRKFCNDLKRIYK